MSRNLIHSPFLGHSLMQLINHLTQGELTLGLPKSPIHPKTFILKPSQSLFLGGLARLDYLEVLCSTVEFLIKRTEGKPQTSFLGFRVCVLHCLCLALFDPAHHKDGEC